MVSEKIKGSLAKGEVCRRGIRTKSDNHVRGTSISRVTMAPGSHLNLTSIDCLLRLPPRSEPARLPHPLSLFDAQQEGREASDLACWGFDHVALVFQPLHRYTCAWPLTLPAQSDPGRGSLPLQDRIFAVSAGISTVAGQSRTVWMEVHTPPHRQHV